MHKAGEFEVGPMTPEELEESYVDWCHYRDAHGDNPAAQWHIHERAIELADAMAAALKIERP